VHWCGCSRCPPPLRRARTHRYRRAPSFLSCLRMPSPSHLLPRQPTEPLLFASQAALSAQKNLATTPVEPIATQRCETTRGRREGSPSRFPPMAGLETCRSTIVAPQILWCQNEEQGEQRSEEYGEQLLKAAAASDDALVRHLIELNVDVNAEHETLRTTPLHFAAAKGQASIVNILLHARASLSATTWNGSTALHVAAQNGHEGVVSALLQHGACLSAKDAEGKTARDKATSKGHWGIVKLLNKHR